MSILRELVEAKRRELRENPLPADLRSRARDVPPPRDFEKELRGRGCSLIAEIKRASPSKGPFDPNLDAAATARVYETAGASAISCLTNRSFQGSNADLEAARGAVSIPVMRKEFIVDPGQIWEARVLGADAVLLLAQVLEPTALREFREMAAEVGMASLVECYSERELDTALDTAPRIVGVNNRDLGTFEVDLGRSVRLRARVPQEIVFVSESGVATRKDVQRLEEARVDAVLIGEEIVRSRDRAAKIRELGWATG